MVFSYDEMLEVIDTDNRELLREQLRKGFPVHAEQEGLLSHACYLGRLEMVQILVEQYGADVTFRSYYPFLCACMGDKNLKVIKYFIRKGVDVNSIENNMPLFFAAMRGNLAAVKFLIELGMDHSKLGYLALRYAIKFKQHEVAEYLQILKETSEMIKRKKEWLRDIEEELIQKTWHPRRLLWCLDVQETKEVGMTEVL